MHDWSEFHKIQFQSRGSEGKIFKSLGGWLNFPWWVSFKFKVEMKESTVYHSSRCRVVPSKVWTVLTCATNQISQKQDRVTALVSSIFACDSVTCHLWVVEDSGPPCTSVLGKFYWIFMTTIFFQFINAKALSIWSCVSVWILHSECHPEDRKEGGNHSRIG